MTFFKKQKLNLLLLALICVISCFFISQKEGYHMDELLSFELANADFTPWIVPTQPVGRLEKFLTEQVYGDTFFETAGNFFSVVGDVLKNGKSAVIFQTRADVYDEPTWITGQQFKDYITVNGQDAFHYPSVYFNVKDDNHPPLHFMMIHTMSSIFRGVVNPWLGCLVNLFFILGTCTLMIRMGKGHFDSENLGRGMAILYALSLGGMATLLLIRMYAMLTFWCVAALYLHLNKLKNGDFTKHNKLLIFVTVCGFLTQYFFLLIMLPLFGVTVWKIFRDKKNLLCYLRSMVLSGIWGLVLYPFAVDDVLNSGRGQESLENLTGGFSGSLERMRAFFSIWSERMFGEIAGIPVILILGVIAMYLLVSRRRTLNAIGESVFSKKADVLAFIAIPLVFYILVVTRIAPFYEDRYMMPAFAFMAMLLGILFYRTLQMLLPDNPLREKLYIGFCLLLTIPFLLIGEPNYLFRGYSQQQQIAKDHGGAVCVCVYDGLSYYRNLTEFTEYEKTLLTTMEELSDRDYDPVLAEAEEILLMTGRGVDTDSALSALEVYGFSSYETELEEGIFGDRILLLRKQTS